MPVLSNLKNHCQLCILNIMIFGNKIGLNFFLILALLLILIIFVPPFLKGSSNEVVVYVSHDQDYAQSVIEAFEKESGIKVKSVYDTEASKTVGLTNRLIAEKNNPQADVFWNNEVVRAVQLKKEKVLQVYKPENYDKLNPLYKDPEGYWTGFAARARVLVVNTNLVSETNRPESLEDLINPKFAEQVTLADPRFGTNGPHVAALYVLWGKEKFENFFMTLKNNGLDIAQSNGQTRDKTVEGTKWIGFTDTDDANDALVNKDPVAIIYPDQKEGEIGTLVIPNTAMLIKGGKHQNNAKKLIDYLISEKTESKLAFAKSAQMPLLPEVKRPKNVPAVESIKSMNVSWEKIYDNLKPATDFFENKILQ